MIFSCLSAVDWQHCYWPRCKLGRGTLRFFRFNWHGLGDGMRGRCDGLDHTSGGAFDLFVVLLVVLYLFGILVE